MLCPKNDKKMNSGSRGLNWISGLSSARCELKHGFPWLSVKNHRTRFIDINNQFIFIKTINLLSSYCKPVREGADKTTSSAYANTLIFARLSRHPYDMLEMSVKISSKYKTNKWADLAFYLYSILEKKLPANALTQRTGQKCCSKFRLKSQGDRYFSIL